MFLEKGLSDYLDGANIGTDILNQARMLNNFFLYKFLVDVKRLIADYS